jgi:GntR family transcriptional regulator
MRQEPKGWRPDFARVRGRAYLAIAAQIEEAIASGIFRPGERLPSQRVIAEDLGFHLNTVNAAFQEAARRGLITSRAGRGTIVMSPAVQGFGEFDAPDGASVEPA